MSAASSFCHPPPLCAVFLVTSSDVLGCGKIGYCPHTSLSLPRCLLIPSLGIYYNTHLGSLFILILLFLGGSASHLLLGQGLLLSSSLFCFGRGDQILVGKKKKVKVAQKRCPEGWLERSHHHRYTVLMPPPAGDLSVKYRGLPSLPLPNPMQSLWCAEPAQKPADTGFLGVLIEASRGAASTPREALLSWSCWLSLNSVTQMWRRKACSSSPHNPCL